MISWLKQAKEKIQFQGLPCRICWLGMGEREKAGVIFNDLVKQGKVSAPIAIGRDHLDCGSVASPNRETEGMIDGSDAVSDWPLLNLMSKLLVSNLGFFRHRRCRYGLFPARYGCTC